MCIRKLLSILSFVTVTYAADMAYLAETTPLFADKEGQSALGELIVASAVKVMAQEGNMTQVEFIGYMPEGSPTVYEKAGILMSGFEAKDSSTLPILGKKMDEYDTEWIEVSAKGYVKTSVIEKDKNKVLMASKKLFEAKCSTCHNLHQKTEFDPNVWPNVLEAMGAQAGLNKNEKFRIAKYLQNQE